MIIVKYTNESGVLSVTVKGHSNSAPRGEDLICAMATGLAYTLAQNVRDARLGLKGRPKIKLDEGDAVIKCRPKEKHREQIKAIYQVICTGFRLMAHNFPDNICYHSDKD